MAITNRGSDKIRPSALLFSKRFFAQNVSELQTRTAYPVEKSHVCNGHQRRYPKLKFKTILTKVTGWGTNGRKIHRILLQRSKNSRSSLKNCRNTIPPLYDYWPCQPARRTTPTPGPFLCSPSARRSDSREQRNQERICLYYHQDSGVHPDLHTDIHLHTLFRSYFWKYHVPGDQRRRSRDRIPAGSEI